MDENYIKKAGELYYKKNVEAEPLDQNTPIECFVAGAKFLIRAINIHQNKCNISNYIPYNLKKQNMGDNELIEKIIKPEEKKGFISGFYITAFGDPSVGLFESTWELKNDFYFDNEDELENFKEELRQVFEYYSGETPEVITFEEHQKRCEIEDAEYYKRFPIRFLINDRGNFKKAGTTAVYGTSAAEGIHVELPHWIPESNPTVIKSTDPRFREILMEEARELENSITNTNNRLNVAKKRLRLIEQELKYGI